MYTLDFPLLDENWLNIQIRIGVLKDTLGLWVQYLSNIQRTIIGAHGLIMFIFL